MASTEVVSIAVKLDNSQALPAIDQLSNALGSVGTKGTASFNQAGEGAKSMGGHVATGLDSVRLLSQEFGMRLPRAIEAMLSRMPAVTSAIGSMIGVMAGMVALQVFEHLAVEAYHLYNRLFDVNGAMREYLASSAKAADQKLFDDASLETSVALLKEANQQTHQLEQKRIAAGADKPGGGFRQYLDKAALASAAMGGDDPAMTQQLFNASQNAPIYSTDNGKAQAKNERDSEIAGTRINMLNRQYNLEEMQNTAKAQEAALLGYAKIEAVRKNNHAVNLQRLNDTQAHEKELYDLSVKTRAYQQSMGVKDEKDLAQIHPVAQDAGAEVFRIAEKKNKQEASAENTNLDRKERDERIAAQNTAIDAGLQGEAKYQAEREQAIAAIKQKRHDGAISEQTKISETASLNLKYDNEELARQRQLNEETLRMHNETALAGLKDVQRIAAEMNLQLSALDEREKKFSGGKPLSQKDSSDFDSQRADIHATETQKIQALDDAYAEHSKSLQESMTASSLQAFARIEAERQHALSDELKTYDKSSKSDADYKEHLQNIATIDADSDAKRSQLSARNSQEDLRYSQEAAQEERRVREDGMMGWVASYRNGISEIRGMEHGRLVKLQEDVVKEGLTWQETAQRKIDIERSANAEIAQQNQEMQHQIAGDLEAAFTNPVDFIKSQMEKMFFEIIAAWIMKMDAFKTLFGQTMGGLQPGAQGKGGGMLGALGGMIPGTRGIVNGHPDISSVYAPAGGSGTASATVGQTQAGAGGSGVGAAIGDVSSVAHTIGSLRLPGQSGDTSPLGGGNDPYTAGISDAQAQVAINSGTIGTQPSGTGSQMMGIAGAAMGAYTAEQSTVKAFQTGNPLQGAMGDAAAGASIGMLAGPEGALIGAAVGAGVGAAAGLTGWATGEGNNLAARDYYNKSVFPSLEAELRSPNADFQSAVSDVGTTSSQALMYMKMHFGTPAADWVNANYMQKEVTRVLARIENAATGGRQYTAMSAAQFHTGGTIGGFGSLSTSDNEGFIHAMLNETVMNTQASGAHGPVLHAMNSGASASDVAAMYLAGSKPSRGSSAQPGGGDTHHWTVNALDAKSFTQFLQNGGAQQIVKHTNNYASQYAGDGVNG